MYFSDYAPPHFTPYSGEEAVITIATGEIVRALRMARERTAIHRDELTANWERIQVPDEPAPIAPLP